MSDAGGDDGLDGILGQDEESFKNSREYKPGEAVNLEAVNLEDLDGAQQEDGQKSAMSPSKFDLDEELDPKLQKRRDMLVKEAIRESGLYQGPEPSKRY